MRLLLIPIGATIVATASFILSRLYSKKEKLTFTTVKQYDYWK